MSKAKIDHLENIVKNGELPNELATLVGNYRAFVKLYDVDYNAVLKPYEIGAEIRREQEELEKLLAQYHAADDDAEKIREAYNKRVDTYNKSRADNDMFTLGISSSWAAKKQQAYKETAESALELGQAALDKKEKIDQLQKKWEKVHSALYQENGTLYYTKQALAVVDEMCKKFPSHPVGYLCKADYFKREMDWQNEMIGKAVDTYHSNKEMLAELRLAATQSKPTDRIKAEVKKAEKFLTDDNNDVYSAMIASLKKSANAPSAEDKIASAQEAHRQSEEYVEQTMRKMRKRHRFIKFIIWTVLIVGGAIAAYFLLFRQ